MARIIWADPARDDLFRIDDTLAKVAPAYADRVATEAAAAARFLSDFPAAGPVAYADVRKWPVAKSDYVLLYKYRHDSVEIVRVAHAREDWLSDLP